MKSTMSLRKEVVPMLDEFIQSRSFKRPRLTEDQFLEIGYLIQKGLSWAGVGDWAHKNKWPIFYKRTLKREYETWLAQR